MNSRPYVYKCTHKETGRFYIGYRKANKLPAYLDLGIHYFTSSREVKKDFKNYIFEIISEHNCPYIAYETEQAHIFQNRNNPLLINGRNFRTRNHISLNPSPVQIKPSYNQYNIDKKLKYRLEQEKHFELIENLKIKSLEGVLESVNKRKSLTDVNSKKYQHLERSSRRISELLNKLKNNKAGAPRQ